MFGWHNSSRYRENRTNELMRNIQHKTKMLFRTFAYTVDPLELDKLYFFQCLGSKYLLS